MGLIKGYGIFMKRQFQRTPTGYVYRFDGKGQPVPVSEREYHRYVRRAGWSFVFHCIGLLLAVVAAAMVNETLFPYGGAGGVLFMGVLLVAIVFALYKSIAWGLRAPERELGNRTTPPPGPVSDARPRPKVSGFVIFAYAILEIVVGGLAGLVLFGLFEPWNSDAALVAFFVGFFLGAWAIDRICERRTGTSVLEALPPFHVFHIP
ncbi:MULTISPECIES: hypothetical protein [Sphingomonas]|jgi:hypothetical protein|uniref:hypothetical protein n=1 Tax=Sphingomonas TaxID=13687 RepID=UPI000DBBF94B|nr:MULTISPECIES: hypothetical protein [Sphingomonas]PZT92265.1 MAG: hypothetical protein DI625_13020 [Sphingomonas sp.]RSV25773.1 hypothetical protein CA237_12145 [Sphingomonas sp. ABOLH]WCP71791.1 hypothetical protein PPZ50_15815 [Sphingomonas hankookensis]